MQTILNFKLESTNEKRYEENQQEVSQIISKEYKNEEWQTFSKRKKITEFTHIMQKRPYLKSMMHLKAKNKNH